MATPQPVPFLTVEDEDDWIVSFALGPLGASRLTLMRAPRLEFMLQPEQRGVSVGAEAGQRPSLLVAVQWGARSVDVVSTERRYSLDISKVDNAIRGAALSPLGNLSFDPRLSADRSLRTEGLIVQSDDTPSTPAPRYRHHAKCSRLAHGNQRII